MNAYPQLKFTVTDGPLEGHSYSFPALPPGAKLVAGGVHPDIALMLRQGMSLSRVDRVGEARVTSAGRYRLELRDDGTYVATHLPSGHDVYPSIVEPMPAEAAPRKIPSIVNPERTSAPAAPTSTPDAHAD